MSRLGDCNRRSILVLAATWLLTGSSSRLLAEQTTGSSGAPELSNRQSGGYSVEATVMLGPIPLLTRARVGGALLAIEESGTPESGAVALQFGAGTWPDRLKGFNRFGMTQEIVRIDRGRLAESSYYSFMTTSREGNISQAEQAFRSAIDSMPLTIGRGHSTADGCSASIEHETVPATFSWPDCPRLIDQLRARKPKVQECRGFSRERSVLPSFLYAAREAVLSGRPRATARFTHNCEIYTLAIERQGPVITGRIRQDTSRSETEFRLWMASGSEAKLPARIEFRAKSYLKLTLELDERQTVPAFKPILEETKS